MALIVTDTSKLFKNIVLNIVKFANVQILSNAKKHSVVVLPPELTQLKGKLQNTISALLL